MSGEAMEHPPQERDRMRAWPAVALMVVAVAVIAGAIGPAWWLLRAELGQPGRGRGGGMEVRVGPPAEERERLPRRVGGLLQTQIERGEGGGASAEPPAEASRPPQAWSWVDRERGVVRMPIDRAMDLVLERYAAEAAGAPPNDSNEPDEPGEPVPVEVGPPSLDEPPGGGR